MFLTFPCASPDGNILPLGGGGGGREAEPEYKNRIPRTAVPIPGKGRVFHNMLGGGSNAYVRSDASQQPVNKILRIILHSALASGSVSTWRPTHGVYRVGGWGGSQPPATHQAGARCVRVAFLAEQSV